MSKQSVNIIEFSELYNILYQVKQLFIFDIYNYDNSTDFINKTEPKNTENSIIILKKEDSSLFLNKEINATSILVVDTLPLKLEKLLDKINTALIKRKYHLQSSLHLGQYKLDINSRTISINHKKLKLTEKEIEVILFLNNTQGPQTICTLQKEVWGHSFELETHTVETHIYRLRKKILDTFNDENFILNNKDGYFI